MLQRTIFKQQYTKYGAQDDNVIKNAAQNNNDKYLNPNIPMGIRDNF